MTTIRITSRYDAAKVLFDGPVSGLCGANLYGASLRRADLCGANLRRANLRHANLSGADLSGAYLIDANLHNANLSDAYLSGANLRGADLSDADLSGANLRGADLSGANLRGADLHNANLSRANLRHADLSGAEYNWQSHALIAETLRQAAGRLHSDHDVCQRRAFAGLIAVSPDWCWEVWTELARRYPDVGEWAHGVLSACVRDGDGAPEVLRQPWAAMGGER